MPDPVPGSAAQDAQEGDMTTATIEVDEDAAIDQPRRLALITVAVLLPADFNDVDIADIGIATVSVRGAVDDDLTDFIQTTVQEARLVMT